MNDSLLLVVFTLCGAVVGFVAGWFFGERWERGIWAEWFAGYFCDDWRDEFLPPEERDW